MAVPRFLKFLLPLFLFIGFFRALIGAGDFNLNEILVDFEGFEFDTTGLEQIIDVFTDDDSESDELPVSGGSSDAVIEPLVVVGPSVIPPGSVIDGIVDPNDEVDDPAWWDSFISFFEDLGAFFEGLWLVLVEFFSWLGRAFTFVFKVLGIA